MIVFMYHGVVREALPVPSPCFADARSFRRQMEHIRSRFRVVPLADAARHLDRSYDGPPPAVLTFDDGFQSAFELVFPVLEELDLPATVFPVTGLLGSSETLWYCRILDALGRTKRSSFAWDRRSYSLAGPRSRSRSATDIEERLKRLPHPQLLTETRNLCTLLGVDPDEPVSPGSPFRMLDHAAVREMSSSGLVDFGGHTDSHAILSRIPPSEQRREILASLAGIETVTGRPCTLFAYPNGTAGDYGADALSVLRSAGVRIAVTTTRGPNRPDTDLLQLRRLGVNPGPPHVLFRARILRARVRGRLPWGSG